MFTKAYIAPPSRVLTPVSPTPADGRQVSMTAQRVVTTSNSPVSISPQLPTNKSFLWDTYAKNPQRIFGANAEATATQKPVVPVRSCSNASNPSVTSSDDGSTITCSSRTFEIAEVATTNSHHFNSESVLLSKTMVLKHSIDHVLHAETQQKIRHAIKQQDFKLLDKIAHEVPIAKPAIETYIATLKTAQAIMATDHSPSAKIDILARFYNVTPSKGEAAFIDTVRKAAIAQQLTAAYKLSAIS